MDIKIAFEKPYEKFPSKIWFINNIIRLWTKSKYVHVEAVIDNKWIASGNPAFTGVQINDLRPLSDKWEYITIKVDGRKTKKVMKFIESQLGSEYDTYGALFGGGIDIDIDSKSKWYCTELVVEILKMYEVPGFQDVKSNTINTGELREMLEPLHLP